MLKLTIHGHLTRDPEMRVTPKGTPITNFAVASNRAYTDDKNVRHESVDYLEVVSFGPQAEVIAKHFKRGSEFFGIANLQQERWEDKNTKEKRSRHVAKLDEFEFCGKKVTSGAAGSESEAADQAADREPVAAGN